jgi:asparagine synthase (glutamine-hydrolysing)
MAMQVFKSPNIFHLYKNILMCGIAGIIDFNNSLNVNDLHNMTNSLNHRGSDDNGFATWQTPTSNIGFGHQRLSIIDLSESGKQPMYDLNESLCIVYNGEIYNYKILRKTLLDMGLKFKTQTDTEVILNAFLAWGIDAVYHFVGMFAFVIHDKKEQKIHLFRDRAGVKPLYYYFKNGLFLFASELKSFHQHPKFEKKINQIAINLYLENGYIPAPFSIFEDTHKLLQGHHLCLDLKEQNTEINQYWNVYDAYNQPKLQINELEAIQETEKILQEVCESRLISDVPVGLFLSGGYDSSLVTALLQKDSSQKLNTFTFAIENSPINEAPFARAIAAHLGTTHHEYLLSGKEALDITESLPNIYDEPFADSSAIPCVFLSKNSRKTVKVILSADAGDEVFGGYYTYKYVIRLNRIFSKISLQSQKILKSVLLPISSLSQISLFHKLAKVANFMPANDWQLILKNLQQGFTSEERHQLLKEVTDAEINIFADKKGISKELLRDLDHLLAFDYQKNLPDDLLVTVDRATMSVGLEGREPLLDHRLLEFVARLPEKIKMPHSNAQKYLIKEIAHKYIPRELIHRRKIGFEVPLSTWMQNDFSPLVKYYLSAELIKKQGIFNQEILEIIDQYHKNPQNPALLKKIWFILMFNMWYERWM